MTAKNVLLVDDSILFRGTVARALKNAGYSIETAGDGEEALRSVHDKAPDVFLLDMILPKVGGLQVLRALKADPATSQIPIIILSSLSQQNAGSLKHFGAAEYIEKSHTNTSALVRAIHRAMGVSTTDQSAADVDEN